MDTSDADSTPINFLVFKNCYADRRTGAILKRWGSAEEDVDTGLTRPIGMGELLIGQNDTLLPVARTILANFTGTTWKKKVGATWSTVSATANTSFSAARHTTMTQGGDTLFIAGGRPAKWDGTNNIDRVGIPAPTGTITAGVSGTGITGTFTYMFTFYNSTSGLESDWSPESASVSPSNEQVDLTIPTTSPTGNADKVRIYRTLDGGVRYYLLQTQDIATGSYTDTTTDVALQANAAAADSGEFGLPPSSSHICATFSKRIWWVDSTSPRKLSFSKPWIGNDIELEYYPQNNVITFDDPITALIRIPGRLLVFHPRHVSALSGFTTDDFRVDTFAHGTGTMFADSIASNGKEVVFISEEGIVSVGEGGRQYLSRPIDEELQPVLRQLYNDDLYISTIWSPSLRQFIFMFAGSAQSGAPWIDSGSGALVEWEDSDTMATAEWEDATLPSTTTLRRVKLYGWSPDLAKIQGVSPWTEYTFPYATDLSADSTVTFLFQPSPSSDLLAPQEHSCFMGYFDGSEGDIISLFDPDLATDDGTNIDAELITGRIVPGDDDATYNWIHAVIFKGADADPSNNGATINYLRDHDDPHVSYDPGDLLSFQNDGDRKKLTYPRARWIHLYIRDNTSNGGNKILEDFVLEYRDRKSSEGR